MYNYYFVTIGFCLAERLVWQLMFIILYNQDVM